MSEHIAVLDKLPEYAAVAEKYLGRPLTQEEHEVLGIGVAFGIEHAAEMLQASGLSRPRKGYVSVAERVLKVRSNG